MNWVFSSALGFMELPKRLLAFKTKPIPQKESTVEEIQLPCPRKANSILLGGSFTRVERDGTESSAGKNCTILSSFVKPPFTAWPVPV